MGEPIKPVAWRWRYDDEGLTPWSYGYAKPGKKSPHRSIMEPVQVEALYGPEAASRIAELEAKLATAVGALEQAKAVIEMFKDADTLAEGVHCGLRKGTDAPDAHKLWTAISDSQTSAWSDAIEFALDPYFSMWGGDKALTAIGQVLASIQERPLT